MISPLIFVRYPSVPEILAEDLENHPALDPEYDCVRRSSLSELFLESRRPWLQRWQPFLIWNFSNEKKISFVIFIQENDRVLSSGRIQHDSDPGSHGLGRKVAVELSADRSSVSVGTGHLNTNNFNPIPTVQQITNYDVRILK